MRALAILALCGVIIGCGDDTPQLVPQPTTTPTPAQNTPQEPMNPECGGVMGTDGGGGFLWKPKADPESRTPGVLVVLFPSRFVVPFHTVEVKRRNGNWEELSYSGKSNGERQTWRGSAAGDRYTGDIIAYDEMQECRWKVNNTGSRQD